MIFSIGKLYLIDNVVSAIYVLILEKKKKNLEEFQIMENSILVLIGKIPAITE